MFRVEIVATVVAVGILIQAHPQCSSEASWEDKIMDYVRKCFENYKGLQNILTSFLRLSLVHLLSFRKSPQYLP